MARPGVAVAPRAPRTDLTDLGPGVVLLIALAALLVWPLAAVLARGLTSPAPPVAVIAVTVVVAVASTLGALGLAIVVAAAVRVRVRGATALVGLFRGGLLLPPFLIPLAVLALGGPGGVLVRGDGGLGGPLAIAIAQSVAFLPHAFALVMRALASVPADAERAAVVLGASRRTVLRRVTVGLAGPRLVTAALVVLGLCLADVATPLLLGADDVPMLAWAVARAVQSPELALGAAVVLSALGVGAALAGRSWRASFAPPVTRDAPPGGLDPTAAARIVLTAAAWLIAAAVLALWAAVPVVSLLGAAGGWHLSLEHWDIALGSARSIGHSLLLAVGVAFAATTLALLTAAVVARGHDGVARVTLGLTRVPAAIPGVVAGVGYATVFGAPRGELAPLVVLLAVWTLPLTLPVALDVLAGADRASEHAALSLGAGRLTTLRRVVLPALSPAAAWIFGHGFGLGLTAVGTVIVLAERGRVRLGVLDLLLLAGPGSVGAACAIATVLAVLAGAAALLARAAAGRQSIPTLLA